MTPGELAAGFTAMYGRTPDGVWAAPGRVNVIGEHTDYADGFVLPVALPHRTYAAVALRDDGAVHLASAESEARRALRVSGLLPGLVDGWAAYPAGVFWALREAGHIVSGADVLVSSDVPVGAGLSSSAALECSVGLALVDLLGLPVDRRSLAGVCRRAENEFVGVPTGVMDQTASLCCTAGHALFLDCRSLAFEQVPFSLSPHGLELLVIDTRAPHRLVDGAYADRRNALEAAAAKLGVAALRDVSVDDLPAALQRLDEPLRPRVSHVVTENARVRAAVDRMRAGDHAGLGRLMTASHTSLRDDYQVSCPELDVAVAATVAAGALGARLTGGGFGGSAIALVERADRPAVEDAVRAAYDREGFAAPAFFGVVASEGAQRLT